jgi:hypothetical protein
MNISSKQCISGVWKSVMSIQNYLDLERLADLLGVVEECVAWGGSLEPTPIAPEGIHSSCLSSSTNDDSMMTLVCLPRQVSDCSTIGSMSSSLPRLSPLLFHSETDQPNPLLNVTFAPTGAVSSQSDLNTKDYIPQDVVSSTMTKGRTRRYNTAQWEERFQQLLLFRMQHGHMFVPHDYPANPKLSQWVKRYVISNTVMDMFLRFQVPFCIPKAHKLSFSISYFCFSFQVKNINSS